MFVDTRAASITTALRTTHGANAATTTAVTTAAWPTARRHPKPATSQATRSAARIGGETGRTSVATPSSNPMATSRGQPNRHAAQGPCTTTSTAPSTSTTNNDSDSGTAVWSTRLGQRATAPAATRAGKARPSSPRWPSSTERVMAKTSRMDATWHSRFTATTTPVCHDVGVSRNPAARTSGYPTG